MEIESFLNLPTAEVVRLVRARGPLVCVFPINGTRRWFLLEHPPETWGEGDFLAVYYQRSIQRQLEIYRLFIEHGVDTLLMPLFGPDLMERGYSYQQAMFHALVEMATHPVFTDFYREYGVRVRFYGDYRKYLRGTDFAEVCDVFDQLAETTRAHNRFRLYYGLFAQDATETVAEIAVQYFQQHGQLPDKRAIVRHYYGEEIPPVNLFIGFDRFSAFDMPLLSTGTEDLYFTVRPSFYLDAPQLRAILYDHLFARRVEEPEYQQLTPEAVQRMRDFYAANRHCTLGVGVVRDGLWYPLETVTIPASFTGGSEKIS